VAIVFVYGGFAEFFVFVKIICSLIGGFELTLCTAAAWLLRKCWKKAVIDPLGRTRSGASPALILHEQAGHDTTQPAIADIDRHSDIAA